MDRIVLQPLTDKKVPFLFARSPLYLIIRSPWIEHMLNYIYIRRPFHWLVVSSLLDIYQNVMFSWYSPASKKVPFCVSFFLHPVRCFKICKVKFVWLVHFLFSNKFQFYATNFWRFEKIIFHVDEKSFSFSSKRTVCTIRWQSFSRCILWYILVF